MPPDHKIGSLVALSAKLPTQPLTSHPSVKSLLENGALTLIRATTVNVMFTCTDFDYSEAPVVVSGNLITRCAA